jgi:hypothetical protein
VAGLIVTSARTARRRGRSTAGALVVTYQASMSQLAAAEAANVETEPANDGSRLLSSSSQSLVILYRVSDR